MDQDENKRRPCTFPQCLREEKHSKKQGSRGDTQLSNIYPEGKALACDQEGAYKPCLHVHALEKPLLAILIRLWIQGPCCG